MENNEPITLEDKKRLVAMLKTEEGELFIKLLKDMHVAHLDLAQGMYLKVVNPSEQVVAQVNQAAGVKEVLDFIDATRHEVEENKREEEEGTK